MANMTKQLERRSWGRVYYTFYFDAPVDENDPALVAAVEKIKSAYMPYAYGGELQASSVDGKQACPGCYGKGYHEICWKKQTCEVCGGEGKMDVISHYLNVIGNVKSAVWSYRHRSNQ